LNLPRKVVSNQIAGKTLALLLRGIFSTEAVEKGCGNGIFTTDKFLNLLDFQQNAHASGTASFSF
jgi:hypothetical protein